MFVPIQFVFPLVCNRLMLSIDYHHDHLDSNNLHRDMVSWHDTGSHEATFSDKLSAAFVSDRELIRIAPLPTEERRKRRVNLPSFEQTLRIL